MASGTSSQMAARTALWAIILSAISCFCVITFMRPTKWYITDPDFVYIRNNMTLAWPNDWVAVATQMVTKDGKTTMVNIGKDVPLWSGNSAFPVTLQWGSVMLCALAVAGLQALSCDRSGAPANALAKAGVASGMAKAWKLARRLGATQLPPYKFWAWWCDGLSVADAFLAMVWIGLAFIYLYYNITRKFEQNALALTPPPSLPPSPPLPPPVLAGNTTVNVTTNAAVITKIIKKVDLLSPLFQANRLDKSADSFGETLRGLLMVMFIPVARLNFMKHITGSDFAIIIKYHRWMSWGTILVMFIHGSLYMIQWGANASFAEKLSWNTDASRRNVCGLIACIFGLLIAFTSMSWFRVTNWHIFRRVHLFGAMAFVIFGLMHYKNLVNWILPGLIVYAIDRFGFRLWQMLSNWTSVGPQDVHIEGNVVTLRLHWQAVGGRTVTPGQTVYIRCPSVSLLQSHPFSVADVAHTEDGAAQAVLHMSAQGPWTHGVCSRLARGNVLHLQVEGPYTTQLDHYKPAPVVIMVAGGMGVTPLLGLLRHYLSLLACPNAAEAVPKVHLIWSSRSLAQLKALGSDLLNACHASGADPASKTAQPGWLSLDLHYTGFELEEASQHVDLAVAPGGKPPGAHLHEDSSEDLHSSLSSHEEGGVAAVVKLDRAAPQPTPLRVHPGTNPLVYALCTLLGFLGAWAGLLAAAYYDGYYTRTTATGPKYLAVGALQFVFILCGAALPPLAVLAINDLAVRRHKSSGALGSQPSGASTNNAHQEAGSGVAPDCAEPSVTKGPAASQQLPKMSSATTTLRVLPGYVLAPLQQLAAPNAPTLRLVRGRPDLPALISALANSCAGLEEVDVLVAAQDGFSHEAVTACAKHNMLRCKAGVPALRCKRVAFHN